MMIDDDILEIPKTFMPNYVQSLYQFLMLLEKLELLDGITHEQFDHYRLYLVIQLHFVDRSIR